MHRRSQQQQQHIAKATKWQHQGAVMPEAWWRQDTYMTKLESVVEREWTLAQTSVFETLKLVEMLHSQNPWKLAQQPMPLYSNSICCCWRGANTSKNSKQRVLTKDGNETNE